MAKLEAELPATKQRFQILDSWRGICALLVALYHLNAYSHVYALPIVRNAWIFVDFFFVLSGFVICYAYERRLGTGPSTVSFVLRRFGRLWPLHVATLAIFVMLDLAKYGVITLLHVSTNALPAFAPETRELAVLSVLANVGLVQSLGLYSTFSTMQWNYPSWSISVEFYTYLVFAAICFLPARARDYGAASLCVLGGAIIWFFSPTGISQGGDLALFRCLYSFFAGILVYRTFTRTTLTGHATVHEIVAAATVILFTLAPSGNPITMAAPLVFGYVIWVFAHGTGAISAFLNNAPAKKIGDWSYSIYMVHAFIALLVFSVFRVCEDKFHLTLFTVNRPLSRKTSHYLRSGWEMRCS